MTPERRAVCERTLAWRPQVQAAATDLDPWLVLAMVAQESGGNPWAIRPEPTFWHRYGDNFVREATGRARYWTRHPDLVSTSYGLLQVLYVTAVELGFDGLYPTELCDPVVNLQYGTEKLRRCFTRAATELDKETSALLFYNGGGDLLYPARVRAWRDDLAAVQTGDI